MNKIEMLVRRKVAKLSQEELAKRLGVTRGYIIMVERGKKPLSKKLNSKLEELFRDQPPLFAVSPERGLITVSSSRGVDCPKCGGIDLEKLRDSDRVEDIVWGCKECRHWFRSAEAWHLPEEKKEASGGEKD